MANKRNIRYRENIWMGSKIKKQIEKESGDGEATSLVVSDIHGFEWIIWNYTGNQPIIFGQK